MHKILEELDPFFFMAAVVIAGMTILQMSEISYTPPNG